MDKNTSENLNNNKISDDEIILYSENYDNNNSNSNNNQNNVQNSVKSESSIKSNSNEEEVMLTFEEYYLELCRNGDIEELINLMKEAEKNFNPNMKDQRGNTALHMACGNGHLNIVKYLINELKCEVNVTNESLNTPLSWACLNGQKEIVQFLIDNGANIELKNNQGKDPSEIAYDSGNWEISEMLIDLLDKKKGTSIKEEVINEKDENDSNNKDK